ncbi:MAG TPA: nucleotidyltransferase family protein [Vicinamibacterales bacterium]|nr:nucleotidyltransferase family protein [Vicinamibacterales bacterium]
MTQTRWSPDERLLCETLVAETPRVPPARRPGLLEAARRHRLLGLLARRVREAGDVGPWTPAQQEGLAAALREEVVIEALRRPELARVVAALAADDLPAVLFKGGALAYTMYPAPHLRPRLDTDLLVREGDLPAVRRALERLGYDAAIEITGTLVTAQCHYARVDRYGVRHALDVHWRPFNPARFAGLLAFDEVRASARPMPPLSPHALAPAPEHQLLFACVHRLAHHADAPDLLWLYDVHLLATSLEPGALAAAIDLAARKRVLALCLSSLHAARACFGTRLPEAASSSAGEQRALAEREGAAAYLDGARPLVAQLWLDVRALDGWRARWRLVREHVLPPAAYVRARYGTASRLALPFLYAYRVCRGAPRWFRR